MSRIPDCDGRNAMSIAQLLIQQLQLPRAELRLKSRLDEAPKTAGLKLDQQGLTLDAVRVIRSIQRQRG